MIALIIVRFGGGGIRAVFRGAWVYGGRGRIRDILDEKDDTT